MKSIIDCKISRKAKEFSKTEKGKTFKLQSIKDFDCDIVDIDNCVFKGVNLKRSDWLFLVSNKNTQLKTRKSRAYYVELKGIDIKTACEQLYNAIDKTKSQIPNHDIEAKIISVKGFQPELLNNENYRKVRRLINKEILIHKVHRANSYTYTEII